GGGAGVGNSALAGEDVRWGVVRGSGRAVAQRRRRAAASVGGARGRVMEREVRYCTTEDGVRIAYCVEGEGPPLVVGQQLVESFSVDHIAGGFRDFYGALAQRRRVIRYDLRGSGLSDRGQYDMSCESLVRDLEAVVRSLNNSPVSLLGD